MHICALDALEAFSFSAPFVAIAALLIYYFFLRVRWRLSQRAGKKKPVFRPSSAALGIALLFVQVLYRPSVASVAAAQQEKDTENDEEGDPECKVRQLGPQLKKIRRGEPVDQLVLKL